MSQGELTPQVNEGKGKQTGDGGGLERWKNKPNVFDSHWKKRQVREGLDDHTLIQGTIKINRKSTQDAYVSLTDESADILISGKRNRNRALTGDKVAVQVEERKNWRVFIKDVERYEKSMMPQKIHSAAAAAEDVEIEEGEASGQGKGKGKGKETEMNGKKVEGVLVEEKKEVELGDSREPTEGTPVTGIESPPTTSGKGSKVPRYVSVKDVLKNASPVVHKLIDMLVLKEAGKEEEKEVAQDPTLRFEKFFQRTGKVVAIIKESSRRISGHFGHLSKLKPTSGTFVAFMTTDLCMPSQIMIESKTLPRGFMEEQDRYTKHLYVASITEWNEKHQFPRGELVSECLGDVGEIEAETCALLAENNVNTDHLSKKVCERRDLRKKCIFTIDPPAAHDLDDALHCTELMDGLYEVGVHIADVSYFVEEDTDLDKAAKERATSVYLVQKVIPMLPRRLCEDLCSLKPDKDRLSFSVILKISGEGEVMETEFVRTVIHSCAQLSYEHAQGIIENSQKWGGDKPPEIFGNFSEEDVKKSVLQLHKIAKKLRQKRFDNGALNLDQVKIQFALDETDKPTGFSVFQQKDSHKLVEEFMLLANTTVAKEIHEKCREKAILRTHPPPHQHMLQDLKENCENLGFPIEIDSAKSIQQSLEDFSGKDEVKRQMLVALCTKSMKSASYFCCGTLLEGRQPERHYSLNETLFTHFTSPIRRYPDIMVHRTLAAALGDSEATKRDVPTLQAIAEHCNEIKAKARILSDKSNELFLYAYIKEAGPLEEKGVVMQVLDKSFDILILRLGVSKRVFCHCLLLEKHEYMKSELTLKWKPDDKCQQKVTQKLEVFSLVTCVLKCGERRLQWLVDIKRPERDDPTVVKQE